MDALGKLGYSLIFPCRGNQLKSGYCPGDGYAISTWGFDRCHQAWVAGNGGWSLARQASQSGHFIQTTGRRAAFNGVVTLENRCSTADEWPARIRLSLITRDLSRFQQRLGYEFKDIRLLEQALTHRSYSREHNERLEFLGDSLVNALVADMLYVRYPEVPEGPMTQMRASLVCGNSLAAVARGLDLGTALLLGDGAAKTGGHRLDSILADAYEALVAAIYLDSGWDDCARVVGSHFDQRSSGLEGTAEIRDSKSRLQEWLQARGEPLPEYQILDVRGPGHAQHFRVSCRVISLPGDFVGEGSNRRAAEQEAAALAIEAARVAESNEYSDSADGAAHSTGS